MKTSVSAVVAVEQSTNRRLGDVSATYVTQASCPDSCPLKDAGCYAEFGPISHITRRVNRAAGKTPAQIARLEARAIDRLTGKRLLRLHVVGDARTNTAARLLGRAAARYSVRGMAPRRGKKTWTYTHSWGRVSRQSWTEYISVLASVECISDALAAMARGYASALLVSDHKGAKAHQVDGVTVLPCPEQTRGIPCDQCGLCRDDARLLEAGIVIAFAVHGVRANTARLALPIV